MRGEVRFDDGYRALYATDASNYRQVPIGVVLPRDAEDVVEAVRVCREAGAPILGRGGGTSLAGQCCNVAVVLDFSRHMNRVLSVDPESRTAVVEPGVVLDDLQREARRHGLRFGPDPATHDRCTLGGMIGNNSCGIHSQMAGRTSDNVEELEVLTYDGLRIAVGATDEATLARLCERRDRVGDLYRRLRAIRDTHADDIRRRFPRIPRRVSGFNLDELLPENGFHVARALVGTEGTCAIVLRAKVRLVPEPKATALALLGFADVATAADRVPAVVEAARPVGLEGVDGKLAAYARRKGLHPDALGDLPEGDGWLFVEVQGEDEEDARRAAEALARRFEGETTGARVFADRARQEAMWKVRESGLGATARVPGSPDTWPGWEDSAVAPEDLGTYLRELRRLFDEHGYDAALYGHFGQGCVHTRIPFDLASEEGLRAYRAFVDEASDLVARLGGSFSGEHGDGQSRAELLPKMYGATLVAAMRAFKAAWDPENRMNPGKAIEPYGILENLRLGADYRPWEPGTKFAYPDDDGRLSRAAQRCVGVGACRKTSTGTMCPSYMVTLAEEHSTRGRAHLLFEMMQGDALADGWRSEAVREALDLCLACKGCAGECPVNVDMATYKAEFMHHHYEGRLRPRRAYAFGLVDVWARLASKLPRAANFVSHARWLAPVAKKVADVAPAREIPRFAPETFRARFRRRRRPEGGRARVVLWPDTFHDHFHPHVAEAAVDVLEAAGFRVEVPDGPLCCGRPLYDFGMLGRAEKLLRRDLGALREAIRAGVPVVGLEPSCVSVFRGEMLGLLPDDEDARRLAGQTFTLGEFLDRRAGAFRPRLAAQVALHGHCHAKSVLDFAADARVLRGMGADVEVLDSGCCGLAGSFGFAAEHYDVSMRIGERVLLPAARAAPADTLVVTDGFSCRTQVEHGASRRTLHLAEVVRDALRSNGR